MLASLSARLIATFTGGALKVKRVTSSDDGTVEDPEVVMIILPVVEARRATKTKTKTKTRAAALRRLLREVVRPVVLTLAEPRVAIPVEVTIPAATLVAAVKTNPVVTTISR